MNIPTYITQITKKWIADVSKKVAQGTCIRIEETEGSRIIGVDIEALKQILELVPEDLTHDDITDWDEATDGFLDEEDYDALSGAIDDLSGVVDDILSEMSSFLTVGDIGVTVASQNHTHDEYLTEADLDGYALEDDLLDLAEEVADIDLDILDLTESIEIIIDDIYDESGNLNFVTTNTHQIITGAKYFGKIGVDGSIYSDPSFDFYSDSNTPRGRFAVDSQGVHFQGFNGGNLFIDSKDLVIRGGGDTGIIGSVQFRKSNGTIGSYIEGLYDGPRFVSLVGGNLAYFDARLGSDGYYRIVKSGGTEPPDDESTTTRELAVRGWVNEHFPRKPSGSQLYTGDADLIDDINWDGTLLKYHKIRVSYFNGLYKAGYTDLGWTTIDTPTLYTPT